MRIRSSCSGSGGSISSYGGLFGGLIGFAIWTARNRDVPRETWGEIGTMGLVIPWFFGRLGCASVHDHPGALAPDWFLALEFPRTALLPAGPRHDLGFYEAIWWGVILVTMLALDRKPRRRGFYMALIPLMYAPARFAFDFLRVPADLGGDARYAGLTPAQYFSVALFALGLYMAYRASKNPVVQWRAYEPPESDESKQAAVVVLEDDEAASTTTTPVVTDASPIVEDEKDDSAPVLIGRRRAGHGERDLLKDRGEGVVVALRVGHEADQIELALELILEQNRRAHGDVSGPIERKAVHAGADRGEGDRAQLLLLSELEALHVAALQEHVLALIAPLPDGPHGVNDVTRGQRASRRDHHLAGGQLPLLSDDRLARS